MENEEEVKTAETETNAGEQTTETGEVQDSAVKTYTQEEVDKLLKSRFTQEQVNKMIEDRLKRASQKSVKPSEPSSNNDSIELERVRGEMQSLHLKMAEYEKQIALSKYQIDEKYAKYVDYEVLHSLTKDKDYATALDEFFSNEENKKYLVGGEEKPLKPQPRPKNTNLMENSKAKDNALREAFGLK